MAADAGRLRPGTATTAGCGRGCPLPTSPPGAAGAARGSCGSSTPVPPRRAPVLLPSPAAPCPAAATRTPPTSLADLASDAASLIAATLAAGPWAFSSHAAAVPIPLVGRVSVLMPASAHAVSTAATVFASPAPEALPDLVSTATEAAREAAVFFPPRPTTAAWASPTVALASPAPAPATPPSSAADDPWIASDPRAVLVGRGWLCEACRGAPPVPLSAGYSRSGGGRAPTAASVPPGVARCGGAAVAAAKPAPPPPPPNKGFFVLAATSVQSTGTMRLRLPFLAAAPAPRALACVCCGTFFRLVHGDGGPPVAAAG